MKRIDRKIMLLFNLGLCVVAIFVDFIALITGDGMDIKDRIIALGCMIALFFYVFRNLLHYRSEEEQRTEQNNEQR